MDRTKEKPPGLDRRPSDNLVLADYFDVSEFKPITFLPQAPVIALLSEPEGLLLKDRASAIIEVFSDGSFQESEGGFEALLLPVRDRWDDIIDIVAWRIG